MRLSVEDFNQDQDGRASELLMHCAPIPSWRDRVMAERPYADAAAVMHTAGELAAQWSDRDVLHALADHPRIGERAAGDSAQAAASRREQSGLEASESTQQQWLEANAEYERRFGCIFLIRAAGRTSQEMLAHLQQRLTHSEEYEHQIRREQLVQIALLRLSEALGAESLEEH